jgi:hypothetical protein
MEHVFETYVDGVLPNTTEIRPPTPIARGYSPGMSKTAVRRVLFKSFWAAIGLAIAVSLFKLAFTGSTQNADGAPLTPTGKIPPEEVVAEKGTISNSLTIDGTIVIDKPVSAASPVTGVLAHRYAETGTKVKKGDGTPPRRPVRATSTRAIARLAMNLRWLSGESGLQPSTYHGRALDVQCSAGGLRR